MTTEEFDTLLAMWGRAYGEHRPYNPEEDKSPTGDSPFARVMEFAPGKRVRRLDVAYRRACRAVRGGTPVWARDAVHFAETRSYRARVLAVDGDPVAERVESAVMQLQRTDDLLGRVLRAEYCRRGGQGDKAKVMELSRLTYRERLAEARGWLRHALAA